MNDCLAMPLSSLVKTKTTIHGSITPSFIHFQCWLPLLRNFGYLTGNWNERIGEMETESFSFHFYLKWFTNISKFIKFYWIFQFFFIFLNLKHPYISSREIKKIFNSISCKQKQHWEITTKNLKISKNLESYYKTLVPWSLQLPISKTPLEVLLTVCFTNVNLQIRSSPGGEKAPLRNSWTWTWDMFCDKVS